uniref:uncharacterized protein LOC124035032 n=1 Tax=Oncorhynchus gorbuscha TaxID=8017 RepID=UPI001EAE9545|nr:uncharacterized protein LOC124035032 [Oncorhynchus gorbuscha]
METVNNTEFLGDFTLNGDHPPRLKDTISRDSIVINPAPPARYLLKTKRKDVDGRDGVRRWTIGNHNPCKRNKTLLILGEVGAGKTTLVNAMVNFAIRVKWEDNARFQITERFKDRETCWAHDPRTNAVTAYEIFGWEDTELPFSLTLIDTPGIEDRDGLRPLIEKLRMLLEEERVDHIDAVCHVVKATQNCLTEHQRNIFDAFLSLLGKDMKDNIITLITHSDETRPEVLDIIMEYKLLGDKVPVHFTFNTHLFQTRNPFYDKIYETTWENSMKSMRAFFDKLNGMQHQRTKQTIEVLVERLKLEDCFKHGRIPSEVSAICCTVCEMNCHTGCVACHSYFCQVMLRGKCTMCPQRCSHKKHVRGHQRYADDHKNLRAQLTECFQNMSKNSLMPHLEPSLKNQMQRANEKGDKQKLKELEEKKGTIADLIKKNMEMERE